MPYTNAQKKQHIYELQTYLYAISLFNNNIPQVLPDGVYGKDTVAAVRAFQQEYGLPETGNTDPLTWNRVVSVYRSYINSAPVPYNVFPSAKYVCSSGDKGELIYIIQAMLNDISGSYENFPVIDVCGNYNDTTMDAVKMFQKKTGLPQNGKVDSSTWNMLVRCCEHINKTLH
ncbi:MAG TPA: peptidoglycan-binding protein [Ruminococcus sp.]|nr:peptidoglycan-binding protein [Ruminococcus sp.]